MRKRVNTRPKKNERESFLCPTIKTSFVRPIKKIDCLTTINLYNLNNLIPWKTRYKVTINILKMQALVGKTIRYITFINRLFPFSRHYYSLLMSLNQCFSLNRMNNTELARTLPWRENALFKERERTFSLNQMNNTELARTLSWRELEIANTELWEKRKGKTHFSRNEKRTINSRHLGDTSGLVVALQKACTDTTSIL